MCTTRPVASTQSTRTSPASGKSKAKTTIRPSDRDAGLGNAEGASASVNGILNVCCTEHPRESVATIVKESPLHKDDQAAPEPV
jgi:hypothetical protein